MANATVAVAGFSPGAGQGVVRLALPVRRVPVRLGAFGECHTSDSLNIHIIQHGVFIKNTHCHRKLAILNSHFLCADDVRTGGSCALIIHKTDILNFNLMMRIGLIVPPDRNGDIVSSIGKIELKGFLASPVVINDAFLEFTGLAVVFIHHMGHVAVPTISEGFIILIPPDLHIFFAIRNQRVSSG